jgi:4-aminobutyrate aminotransferase-like enzyme/Ser/Thr protein kinase RdoA (MazF antagonist)
MSAEDDIRFLLCKRPSLDLDEVRDVVLEHYGIEGDYRSLHGERDQNYCVAVDGVDSFVFKISNANEKPELIDFQVSALNHIAMHSPTLSVPQPVPSRHGLNYVDVSFASGQKHFVRMTKFVPGSPLDTVENRYTAEFGRNVGKMLGNLDIALRGFFHPAADHDHPWNLAHGSRLAPFTHHIKDTAGQKMVRTVLDHAGQCVEATLLKLRRQVIHQDAHQGNILVNRMDPAEVTGIIDFGDLLYGTLAAEVALASMSAARAPNLALEVLCDVTAGFDEVLPLTEDEIDLIFDLICIRHAMIVTVFATRAANGDLGPALLDAQSEYIEQLAGLGRLGRSRTTQALRKACRFPARCPGSPAEAESDEVERAMLATRHDVLGRYTKHFYEKPLHFERSFGAYLYGMDGRRYLDFYNNVPQVGHCHPHVVKAISRQAAALNTNTRYMYNSVLEYAERLTSKLAPHLDACIFVNSGSEANDVAWQIARFVTGHSGGMLMEDAYHGITDPIRQFSPGHPDVKLPPFLQGLAVPDPYRDPGKNIAIRFAADADRAIADLKSSGHPLAAFIIDSAFCSSGVPDVPPGYLHGVAERVRAAGGLMICDEVQSGFGRMGQWWGHEHHGVKADIVTMGKPAGNGHPLGVVVTSKVLLERFLEHSGFFSTFGGNPVACAAGNSVLDVIERDKLIENGREVGDYLRDQLRELATRQSLIGNVRGHGMLAGLELVTDREAKTPATEETKRLIELMRQNQVLVGKDGRFNNVLKLRPPLILQRHHVDQFIAALDASLTALDRP